MNLKVDAANRNISFGINNANLEKFSKKAAITAAVMGAAAARGACSVLSGLSGKKGMPVDELSVRASLLSYKTKKEKDAARSPEVFNQEVSYNYFANGRLRYIQEYVTKGKEKMADLSDFQKENKLNTLKYQKAIVDAITGERVLVRNKSLRENLWFLVTSDNDAVPDNFNGDLQKFEEQYEQKTQARIKVLNAYKTDDVLRENNIINDFIGWFVSDVYNDEQAELLIGLLKNNVENNNIYFFANLDELLKNNINPDLIKKVQSDKNLYENISPYTLYNIGGSDEKRAGEIIKTLDEYQKNYPYSEKIPENLNKILSESFSDDQKENPADLASKKMAEINNEESISGADSIHTLIMNMNARLDDIFDGKYVDKNKSDMDNAIDAMNMIREVRTDLHNYSLKYTNPYEKQLLSQMLSKITIIMSLINEMRSEKGCPTLSFADLNDKIENAEIKKILNKM